MSAKRYLRCGHRDLGDSWHGGRPVQCIHQWQAPQQLELGL